jgi:hypothetical protein
VRAIESRDWAELATFVHPSRGLRFSPYGYVDVKHHVLLTPEEVAVLGTGTRSRVWGRFDGTGEPIEMPFPAYYERFVYDRDFATAAAGKPGERIGRGNSLNNIGEAFAGPEVSFVEYHVPGTDRFSGMDWRSLRLVFERLDAQWYLVGIVHDQWTI